MGNPQRAAVLLVGVVAGSLVAAFWLLEWGGAALALAAAAWWLGVAGWLVGAGVRQHLDDRAAAARARAAAAERDAATRCSRTERVRSTAQSRYDAAAADRQHAEAAG